MEKMGLPAALDARGVLGALARLPLPRLAPAKWACAVVGSRRGVDVGLQGLSQRGHRCLKCTWRDGMKTG